MYGVMAIWGVAIAYRRGVEGEEDKLRAHELEQVSIVTKQLVQLCMCYRHYWPFLKLADPF